MGKNKEHRYSHSNNKTKEKKSCFENITYSDKTSTVIGILVKLSDQYEFQEGLQNEGLVSEEIETTNKEFEDVMEQANGCISESKGDTLSTASHQSSKKSQLSRKESVD